MCVMDNHLIQQDICDFYVKLLETQSLNKWEMLCSAWNLWPIIASYTLAVHWKTLNVNIDWLLNINKKDNQSDTE